MAAVAQRCLLCRFAAAKKDFFGFLCLVLNRRKFRALMAAIAKGLFVAFPAGAPPVSFSVFHGYSIGGVTGSVSCTHTILHKVKAASIWIGR